MPGNLPLSQGKRPDSTMTPPIEVPWPPMNLVAEWTTMSAPVLDRPAEVGRGEGVVDHQRHAGLVGDRGDRLDVEHVDPRVADRLAVERAASCGVIARRKFSGSAGSTKTTSTPQRRRVMSNWV